MSEARNDYLSHLTEAERLHENGLSSRHIEDLDKNWCSDCENSLDECECDNEDESES